MEHYEHEHHEHKHKGEVLIERFEEELEDACEYAKLAEEHPECAKLFHAIGREEVTHAYHLRDEILKMGHEIPDEHEVKWHKVLRKYGWEKT